MATSYYYDSLSLDAMKEWFASMQKDIHVLGPLLPAGFGTETQNAKEGAGGDIEVFLEEKLVQHGKRSVSFVGSFSLLSFPLISYHQISFGTLHWPTVPGYLGELIEALLAKGVPFVCDILSV